MKLTYCLASALALTLAPGTFAEEDHFEWAGIFDVKGLDKVLWVAQKTKETVNGYADERMKFVVFKEAEEHGEDLHEREEAANTHTLLEGLDNTFTAISVATTAPAIDMTGMSIDTGASYIMTFDPTFYQTTFEIDVTGVDFISIFTEHDPSEFELNTHYLIEDDGHPIEPKATLPEAAKKAPPPEKKKEWANVLLTTFLVNLATFAGVVLLALGCLPSKMSPSFQGALTGFSSGALLGCAVFLILIESSHMIATKYASEAATAWRWGAAVLGGFLTPLFVFLLEPHKLWHASVPAEGADVEKGKKNGATSPDEVEVAITEQNNKGTTTVFAVCIGDFAHNITDGFAIGVAFKSCSNSLAWSIVAATLYHEIAQELADFVLLTSDAVGCSVTKALLFNFIAGTSVIIGGLIATSIDMDTCTLGVILAFGGGTYIYLAAAEAMPLALAYSNKLKAQSFGAIKRHYAIVLFAFVVGAAAVGLILFNHEHCVPEPVDGAAFSGGGAHAGHGH